VAFSSANLADEAFLRNLELDALFTGGEMPTKLRQLSVPQGSSYFS
jgi:hypothetical protein